MRIRITVDDNLIVQEAEAATISSPYKICPSVTPAFSSLKGLKIGPGWRREIKRLIGGICGCTHLRDLLVGPIAVTAYQTVIPNKKNIKLQPRLSTPPSLLNTCIAFDASGPIVKSQWPKYYQKK